MTFYHRLMGNSPMRSAVYLVLCTAALALYIAAMAVQNWGSLNLSAEYLPGLSSTLYIEYAMLEYRVIGPVTWGDNGNAIPLCKSYSFSLPNGLTVYGVPDSLCAYGRAGFAFSVTAAAAVAAAILTRLCKRPAASGVLAVSAGLLGMIGWALIFSRLRNASAISPYSVYPANYRPPFEMGVGCQCSIAAWVIALCAGLPSFVSWLIVLWKNRGQSEGIGCCGFFTGGYFAVLPLSSVPAEVTGRAMPVVKAQTGIMALISALNAIVNLVLLSQVGISFNINGVSTSSTVSSSLQVAHASLASIALVLHIAVAILCGLVFFFSSWVSTTDRPAIIEWYQSFLGTYFILPVITGFFVLAVLALLADIGIVVYTSYGTVSVIVYGSVAGVIVLVALLIVCIVRVAVRFKLQHGSDVPIAYEGGSLAGASVGTMHTETRSTADLEMGLLPPASPRSSVTAPDAVPAPASSSAAMMAGATIASAPTADNHGAEKLVQLV
eukprot:m.192700 g.192700  ORF g.192700 m.192700 type:complete len:495 (+) comp10059_c0_seq1:61-1545(+)